MCGCVCMCHAHISHQHGLMRAVWIDSDVHGPQAQVTWAHTQVHADAFFLACCARWCAEQHKYHVVSNVGGTPGDQRVCMLGTNIAVHASAQAAADRGCSSGLHAPHVSACWQVLAAHLRHKHASCQHVALQVPPHVPAVSFLADPPPPPTHTHTRSGDSACCRAPTCACTGCEPTTTTTQRHRLPVHPYPCMHGDCNTHDSARPQLHVQHARNHQQSCCGPARAPATSLLQPPPCRPHLPACCCCWRVAAA
jgi:hypothetical protein